MSAVAIVIGLFAVIGLPRLLATVGPTFALSHPKVADGIAKLHWAYSLLGLIVGAACQVGGLILCLQGFTGSTSWTAAVLGFQSKVNDAVPGVILIVAGALIIWITRPPWGRLA